MWYEKRLEVEKRSSQCTAMDGRAVFRAVCRIPSAVPSSIYLMLDEMVHLKCAFSYRDRETVTETVTETETDRDRHDRALIHFIGPVQTADPNNNLGTNLVQH